MTTAWKKRIILSLCSISVVGILTLLSWVIYYKNVSAQIPEPYVSCSQWKDTEWNSLRPYQASPCTIPINEEEQALLCGNDLVVRDSFTVDVNQCDCPDKPCPGEVKCDCEIPRDFSIEINAYDSELPIAGQTELVPSDGSTSIVASLFIDEWRLSDFAEHLPPDVLDSKYDEWVEYYKAYQEWRGKSCYEIALPMLLKTVMFCFDNPANPNYWAFLFPNIPYSSTEDRIGKTSASDVFVKSADFSVEDLKTNWKPKQSDERNTNTKNSEGVLYFPHMEETTELTSLLQSTFVSKEMLSDKEANSIKTEDVEDPTIGSQCTILNVRSNPGDQLFGEQTNTKSGKGEGAPAAKVTYTAVFQCDATNVEIYPGVCIHQGQCPRSGTFSSTIDTYTPLADELWSRTVAGNSSVFRKVYPKVGEEGSTTDKIQDIPAETDVEHISSVDVLSTNAKLYFSHFGGIYDYFLKGIQQAIRPSDFPAEEIDLPDDTAIYDPDTLNEYVSWYLNGSQYRAETNPLSKYAEDADANKITTNTGPLNRLLPQQIMWHATVATPEKELNLGKVGQIERAGVDRHNQIVGCVLGVNILGVELGGFPMPCDSRKEASVDQSETATPAPSSAPSPTSPPGTNLQCKESMPDISGGGACTLSTKKINNVSIPPTMEKIFETAAATYNVPADLIAGVMFAEGGFEPRVTKTSCYGPYTEENIQQAALCEFANCNPDEYNPPCNYDSTQGTESCINGGTHFGPFQQCPNGYNPCNIYDAIMNAAKSLAKAKSASYSGLTSCLGVDISNPSSTGSGGCSKSTWSCEDVITALTNWEGSCNPSGHTCNVLQIYDSCVSRWCQ